MQNWGNKQKSLNFGTKNAYFWARIFKIYCRIWNKHPRSSVTARFFQEIKLPKFGTKNALFGYFWAWNWKQDYHIWNQHPRICPIAKFYEKPEIPKFGTKNTRLGYFWARNWKWYYHIRICLTANFLEKNKIPKFGTKNDFLGIFDKKCLIWVFLDYNFKRTIVILEITNPWICLDRKCREIMKMPKFGTKNTLVGFFWVRILKELLSYLKSAHSNLSIHKISRQSKNV